jgi:beta-lactamase superfamily II metal-dependent hydrolase
MKACLLLRLLIGALMVHASVFAQTDWLEVKPGYSAIVRTAPNGNASEIAPRLPEGTRVQKIGEAARFYSIILPSGQVGWSYKANFRASSGSASPAPNAPSVTKESLLARPDLLQIVVLDVEVGDATLIVCPEENGVRDVILIDTGENDGDRIAKELVSQGFSLSAKPITRFIATHYDHDHIGDVRQILPWTQTVYDHGNNNIKPSYHSLVTQPGVDRRTMTLNYDETFSGSVRMECVAVNQRTDFDTETVSPSTSGDNPNSIATIISIGSFDYFTGGDLTFSAEKSLAKGIRNCDVYHANHHGSRATSSDLDFVNKLDPEVTVASNGTKHGHPSKTVADRLISIGSKFFQTNANEDSRANQPNAKFIGDTTVLEDDEEEDEEGAIGSIRIIVDSSAGKYYVIMPNLPLSEGTFPIEQ